MYCLDTDIIIDILRGEKEIVSKLNALLINHEIFTTPINLCELFKGAYLSLKTDKEIASINQLIENINVLEFNNEIYHEFGKEFSKLKKLGKITQEFDLIIACFSKVNNLILVTRNKKHFENISIKIDVW